ncbi:MULTISPECIES: exosome complex RNA-binding protein Rrp4 [Acidianus]|uniref:Exosome complex component Rrp4 n=1 Tax=Candidatus Acidianus copahuensis TaxID=1160895 RepID=A0A031LMH2_9CREN|nr:MULTISPECIES: exosome complex RNA-binding protein Rrp4 [Acidianus]EZQ03876.1 RNA-binding protein [Candidatus Acidianus copahuensis]NON62028.1 S1 RNA-binding domain-containing protein [Acidianus sp. RZ1]
MLSNENNNKKLYYQERTIVSPGDLIAEGAFQIPWSPYIYKIENKYYSSVVGIFEPKENRFEVIPLKGSFYYPKIGDTVIGLVEDIETYGWIVDIKAPYSAYLPGSSLLGRSVNIGEDIRKYIDVGDYVIAKVENFDRTIDPILSVKGKGLGRIIHGNIIDIMPVKIPRVIGKNKSMMEVLTTETGCEMLVAQNGRVWANCPSKEMEDILIFSIDKIEHESHIKGLTDRIKNFIQEKKGELGVTESKA